MRKWNQILKKSGRIKKQRFKWGGTDSLLISAEERPHTVLLLPYTLSHLLNSRYNKDRCISSEFKNMVLSSSVLQPPSSYGK